MRRNVVLTAIVLALSAAFVGAQAGNPSDQLETPPHLHSPGADQGLKSSAGSVWNGSAERS
ncbi:MAG TPA: hypothetical protein VL156_10200 [Terriglobales bacterium]|nr:hypothetical protein [Terriglobales bacterium]